MIRKHLGWILAIIVIIGLLSVITKPAHAQAQEDVVYLDNGTVVRGTIVEQVPGEQITIRTRDGNQFVYNLGEVDRITKEPAFGQYASASSNMPGYKESGTATLIGVLCAGCGHIYAGETSKGLMILGTAFGAPIVGTIITAATCSGYSCSAGPVLAGMLVSLGAWGYGIYDAGGSANRMNNSHGMALSPTWRPSDGSMGFQLSFSTR